MSATLFRDYLQENIAVANTLEVDIYYIIHQYLGAIRYYNRSKSLQDTSNTVLCTGVFDELYRITYELLLLMKFAFQLPWLFR